MKWIFCAFGALLFWGCAGTLSQTQGGVSEKNSHFFWKVSDDNSHVWVLGSIHFADSSFYPLDSIIENAFDSSQELAVEIDVSNDSVANEVGKESMEQGLLKAGMTLNQVLPADLWNSLDSLCNSWNVPVAGLMNLKPWLAAMSLSVLALQRTGVDPSYGIDAVLLNRANEEGKTVVGLETANQQVRALSGGNDSDSAGIYYLRSTLREISDLDSMVVRMKRAWKTGDDDLLRLVMNEEGPTSGSEEKIKKKMDEDIYENRNVKMAENIKEFLKDDRSIFVVVGAAHLVLDDNNVMELLKKQGFKVERF
ncbi:MAG: TraB/GumN family protein [Fibrobacteraceae bacterium]|nr:TraB/GumN family protein [Fibrobacteraceae bacterium]